MDYYSKLATTVTGILYSHQYKKPVMVNNIFTLTTFDTCANGKLRYKSPGMKMDVTKMWNGLENGLDNGLSEFL